ncbi:SdpI family protein [Paenibacillus sp. FJAT-26967]|uniref:SdpI family protein n=1 Tax=Paenibacillus sp. FJAT-26967 TaxID=1729690 RepID=UPI000837CF52|nr:SdpI family protein [Paenibacillus sp. FJAT-26967]
MTNPASKLTTWSWKDALLLIIAAAPTLFALWVYERLPDQMAIHFGTGGDPNGYQSKLAFILLISLLNLALPLLMKWMPSLDPGRKNYEKFQGFYDLFRLMMTLLLSGAFFLTLLYNLGYDVSIEMWVPLFVGILWMIVGNYIGRARPNYTFGIRTPWTLANEEVWRRTHRMAGPIWMIAGIIFIGVSLIPAIIPPWFAFTAVVLSILIPTVYSYLSYRKLSQSDR